jgi:hypothetical protein
VTLYATSSDPPYVRGGTGSSDGARTTILSLPRSTEPDLLNRMASFTISIDRCVVLDRIRTSGRELLVVKLRLEFVKI